MTNNSQDNKIRLNLGCGSDIKPNYRNIDFYNVNHPSILKCDVRDLSAHFGPNSVSEIYARDILEHIGFLETDIILQHWANLLELNGTIFIRVPDIHQQLFLYDTGVWSTYTLNYKLFGIPENEKDYHKVVFSLDYLCEKLRKCGIKIIKTEFEKDNWIDDPIRSPNANLCVWGQKEKK